MNLQRVNPYPVFYIICNSCLKRQASKTPTYADLDGKPFKSYYCEPCKIKLEQRDNG